MIRECTHAEHWSEPLTPRALFTTETRRGTRAYLCAAHGWRHARLADAKTLTVLLDPPMPEAVEVDL